jgi:hypothetical protein
MAWPKRSRFFLRLGKTRYAPLLLFVDPPHFTSATFDHILSILYEKIQLELLLDPKTGAQIVASPPLIQRPCHVSEAGLHFCYYWNHVTHNCTVLVPQENQSDVLTNGCKRDPLQSSNMTLVVCVISCPKPANNDATNEAIAIEADDTNQEPLMDMTGLKRPAHISHFFAKEASSSSSTVDSPPTLSSADDRGKASSSSSSVAASQSNPKKRKR